MSAKGAGGGNQRPIIIIKKKKAGGHGHHGGAWKVAYADFVTAMMALFIVLWLLTQADMKLKQQLAQFFRNPGLMPGGAAIHTEEGGSKQDSSTMLGKEITVVLGNPQNGMALAAEQTALETEAKELKEALEKMAGESAEMAKLEGSVKVSLNADGLAVEVEDQGNDILFDLASSELKPALVAMLKRLAPVLGKLPNAIQVGGHTDARPYKAHGKTNWDLSYERANKARVVLEASGLRDGQMARVLSYADSEPVNRKDPMASENRRLSILALRRIKAR